jgi:biopolymer transport protein ExbD
MIFYKKERRQTKIDISPLIDVVLSLVIFFILSTTFIQKYGLKLELPKAKTGEASQETKIVINIDREGNIFMDKIKIDEEDLRSMLPDRLKNSTEKKVIIKADEKVQHGKVVKIMDIIRESGAEGLTIATLKQD